MMRLEPTVLPPPACEHGQRLPNSDWRLRRPDETAERECQPPCKGGISRIRHESRYDMQSADQGNQHENNRNNEYPVR